MTKNPKTLAVLGILVLSLALAACATTRQTRSVETSGFLGDYSQLQEGEKGQAQLIYVNPNTKFSAYDAIMIDSVTLWEDSETSELSQEDQQMLTDFFYQALHEKLSKDFQVVDQPEFGAAEICMAIHAEEPTSLDCRQFAPSREFMK